MRKYILINLVVIFAFFATNNTFAQNTGNDLQKSTEGIVKTVVAITGKISNGLSKEAVSVKIIVFDEEGKKISSTNSNSDDGYYYITKLVPGKNYKFAIEANGFLNNEYEVKIPYSDKYLEFTKDFLVYPNVPNTAIKLSVPPFELNKSKIKFGYAILMDEILSILKANPTVNFTIECYPDNKNDVANNMKLTKLRAQNLSDFFEINGVEPQRITIKANSEEDSKNPIPEFKAAKGKKYIGTTYIVVN